MGLRAQPEVATRGVERLHIRQHRIPVERCGYGGRTAMGNHPDMLRASVPNEAALL